MLVGNTWSEKRQKISERTELGRAKYSTLTGRWGRVSPGVRPNGTYEPIPLEPTKGLFH